MATKNYVGLLTVIKRRKCPICDYDKAMTIAIGDNEPKASINTIQTVLKGMKFKSHAHKTVDTEWVEVV